MSAYLDGDDLCAGCGLCCHDVTALRVTDAELARVPLLAPYVTHKEGAFNLLDVPGPCPYLTSDGRCGTFATRPFDCSLFPVNIRRVRPANGGLIAEAMYVGQECPERPQFLARALAKGLGPDVRTWLREATGGPVTVRVDRLSRIRALLTVGLHRTRLLDPSRRLLGRPPRPRKPGPHPQDG